MGLARSTHDDVPKGQPPAEAGLVARIVEIRAERPRCGHRRATARLRNTVTKGLIVNHKKVLRPSRPIPSRVISILGTGPLIQAMRT